MTTSEERQLVLRMIADGKVTPEEGTRFLAALSGAPVTPSPLPELSPATETAETAQPETPPLEPPPIEAAPAAQEPIRPHAEVIDPPGATSWPDTRHWWQVPFWVGAALLLAGAFVLAGALSTGGWCLIFICALPLLVVGLLAVIVAWFARNGPWVHIRVKHSRPGEPNINLSVPLDLGVMAVRVAEPFVPQMRNTGVDDVIVSLKNNVTKDQPVIIDVNDDENGEQVQVIVG